MRFLSDWAKNRCVGQKKEESSQEEGLGRQRTGPSSNETDCNTKKQLWVASEKELGTQSTDKQMISSCWKTNLEDLCPQQAFLGPGRQGLHLTVR